MFFEEIGSLFRNIKGNIFGGYASIPWSTESGTWKSAPESFVFTLTNEFNIKPTKLLSKHNQKEYKEVYHHESYGPTFGNDFGLYSDFHGWACKFQTYEEIDSNNLDYNYSVRDAFEDNEESAAAADFEW